MSAAYAAVTVEVHDVSPATDGEVRIIRRALRTIGVTCPTLLVVPALEDGDRVSWDLRKAPAFAARLRRWQAAGAEIVQHGLSHRAAGPPPPGLAHSAMHRWFSRGLAEFAHLSYPEATARLTEGARILAAVGLWTEGFVAPAWQQSLDAIDAVADQNFRFTAFFHHILPLDDPAAGRVRAPVLTFDAPNAAVDRCKRTVMRVLEATTRDAPLLRVALHPADARPGGPLVHVIRRLAVLLGTRRHVSYRMWLEDRGIRRAA